MIHPQNIERWSLNVFHFKPLLHLRFAALIVAKLTNFLSEREAKKNESTTKM